MGEESEVARLLRPGGRASLLARGRAPILHRSGLRGGGELRPGGSRCRCWLLYNIWRSVPVPSARAALFGLNSRLYLLSCCCLPSFCRLYL